MSESGAITHTSRAEASESYALDTYGTQFAISRKTLINDDLGAFRDWGETAGRMAAETEANLLLNLLLGNPTMGEDGVALFHVDHGNLAASGASLGSVADISALDEARKAMRQMDGEASLRGGPCVAVRLQGWRRAPHSGGCRREQGDVSRHHLRPPDLRRVPVQMVECLHARDVCDRVHRPEEDTPSPAHWQSEIHRAPAGEPWRPCQNSERKRCEQSVNRAGSWRPGPGQRRRIHLAIR